jgi:D-tyrosyl-tRNA(Tyr) deacylase
MPLPGCGGASGFPNCAPCANLAFMRAVIQRVSSASVTIDGQIHGVITAGLLVLLAIEETDTVADIEWLSGKIVRLRIFSDATGLMNLSIQDTQGGLLLISQFTLFASTKKGNRPAYTRSARPEIAVPLYEQFIARLTADLGRPIQTGKFGAYMQVTLTNDGPVTILMDSKTRE